ncbi:HAMP domain-containing sensor histidine kinase [[Mycobacterium] wendilense]|uniref:histidine kinase n=1 Tax=[Mycobacterium] wendilense TaxID=3064284 RepID=A0ABM9M871_9MYCO|nr:HAMP domain-containing sensor histidine kinase [Mycolicibacterium sp. MU0050]CAJ1578730.1 HAMP domain-containing sensor histidine kinase [Mycolicibacterium sp. MU0050]
MSSSLPADAADGAAREQSPRWRSPSTWSLRTRLVAGQVLLLTLAFIVVGVATELALRQYLMDQLDSALFDAAHRSVMMSRFPPPAPPPPDFPRRGAGPGPSFLDAPGQPVGLISAVVGADGTVTAGVLTSSGERGELSAAAVRQLSSVVPRPTPVTVVADDIGRYRVLAFPDRRGNVIVTGLPKTQVNDTMLRVGLIFALVAVVVLIAVSILGIAITRRMLAPLNRVAATAREVANLPLDRGEVALPVRVPDRDIHPATEVGQMGSALNRMLDHISAALSTRQASETRVRQFVADASHELRTPLTAIRGYAELAQRRRGALPAEVAHAMGRVSSETERMTNLVEDLLLLARLDSGRPLDREQVDLSQLAVDTVADAHVAGPEHEWNLDLPDEPVVVVGDAARLHQVLANLLTNARVHTPPGTTVTLALTADDTEALVAVQDNGPGIPAELQPEVFERFARGDSSRSRKGGSTGLGLAIVAAVVKAHGGRIELHSVPNDTVFTVSLPRTPDP